MPVDRAGHTVGAVARLAHVSVRTLRHYDEIGVLRPSQRSTAGYRLYSSEDLERLQQVLFYKALGFGLDDIRAFMADPSLDRRASLVVQRELVAEQALRLQALLDLIDRTLASVEAGEPMTNEEMFAAFGDFDPTEHEREVEERWGETEAFQESARRTRRYTRDDWQRFKRESDEVNAAIAALMDEGVPAEDRRASDAVERHRLLIDRWFYPCTPQMHAALGAMYVADARFAATYERIRPGMAEYLQAATAANAARAGS
jgi:MerR family transcriptional regulator, thiopeptide resistance regulator